MQTLYEAFSKARKDSPDLPFLAVSALSGEGSWTYEQAGREIDRLVACYAAQGWGAGHRVALGVGNHPRHFFHFLALNRLGASVVPLNPDHQGAEIRYTLAHSKVDLVVATEQRDGIIRKAIATEPSLSAIPLVAESDLEHALPASLRPRGTTRTTLDSEAAILYTSGTSGLPKGLSAKYFRARSFRKVIWGTDILRPAPTKDEFATGGG